MTGPSGDVSAWRRGTLVGPPGWRPVRRGSSATTASGLRSKRRPGIRWYSRRIRNEAEDFTRLSAAGGVEPRRTCGIASATEVGALRGRGVAGEDNKAIVRRISEEFGNQGRAEVIDEVFAADVLDHFPVPGQPPGREASSRSTSDSGARYRTSR